MLQKAVVTMVPNQKQRLFQIHNLAAKTFLADLGVTNQKENLKVRTLLHAADVRNKNYP
jgi:hypothetical protein